MDRSPGLRRVRVSAPATSANLGPGFDAIGVALALRGEVELSLADEPARQPNVAERMALEAVDEVFRYLGRATPTVRVSVRSQIPVARGLGASAMLRVAAAVAAAALAGVNTGEDWLLALASKLEGHADNAAPALLGGFQVVVWDSAQLWHVEVPLPDSLRAALFVPDLEMSTDESRRLLPASLTREDAVHNSSRAALLVAGIATVNLAVLRTATDDRIHQPARSQLFPAMYDIFAAATDAGALCAYLSGGGSAILAITDHEPEVVVRAMVKAAGALGVVGVGLATEFSRRGAEVVERA